LTQRYSAFTLVDISNSNVTNFKSLDTLGYNQQQNLNTLIQLIGLRSQPIHCTVTELNTQDLVDYWFGNSFTGLHTVWILEFVSEHTDVFKYLDDDLYFLNADCNDVAFINQLTETVEFNIPVFNTLDKKNKNLYFKKYQ
jgi:hypothetical protein